VQRQNRMNGETHGVEVGGAWQATDWYRLYGAYTFREMQLHADPTLPAATRLGAEVAEGRNPQQQVYLQSTSIRAPLVELQRGVYGEVTYRF
jgi:hypothetical protein